MNQHHALAPTLQPQAPPDLWDPAEIAHLDQAVDYAARVCKGAVSEFFAAPAAATGTTTPGIEIAVEFFVPPASVEAFRGELDRAMIRRNLAYSAARRAARAGPVTVTVLPPCTFGQWRSTWKLDARSTRARRWSNDRQLLDGVVRHAASGWREIFGTA